MKKLFFNACLFACLFISLIANAKPKTIDEKIINPDSCYVATFYNIDSLEIKNDEKIKIVLVNDKDEIIFVNRQKYLAISLPVGNYKIYTEKKIKTIYENNN